MIASSLLLSAVAGLAAAQSFTNLPGALFGPEDPFGSCTSANWPISNVGDIIEPQQADAELQELIAEIDPRRVKSIITNLVNFGTRHTLSTQTDPKRGIGAARDWIYKQMQGFAAASDGRMQVYFDTTIQPISNRIPFPVNLTNVVARIEGTTDPNRTYVVTGHYDSRRIDVLDYTGDAPGADDDASGVAVVMELARVIARKQPKATMIFAATAAEEQGLYGATHLAQGLKNASVNVEGNWNNDIVGTGNSEPFNPINKYTVRLYGASLLYPNASSGSLISTTGIIGGENDSPARNLGRFIAEVAAGAAKYINMQVALIYRPDRYLRGGDHEAFLAAGFAGIRFTEAVENFAHQHQDVRVQNGTQYGDLLKYVDFDYTARVAKTNLATMWSAANAPAIPRNVTINQLIGTDAATEDTPIEELSNDSQINWISGNDPLVDCYELVWRPSGALQWTHSLNVGNTNTVTVNLSKDNVQFGIRAVGKDGKKSPAAFPLPG